MVRSILWGILMMADRTRKLAAAQGVLTRSHALSSIDRQAIPDAGIGSVRPICGGTLDDGCASSDDEAVEGLTSKIKADKHVTGVGNVELGQLLCDSLDDALESTLLRFEISSNETVIAERTAYEVYGGGVFTDGKERKVWIGDVVDPAPTTASLSRSVTMAWGEPCEVETFSLQVVTQNPDGTLCIIKSVPCSAGSSDDICMVEVDLEFKSEGEPFVSDVDETSIQDINGSSDGQPLTEDHRLLNEYSPTRDAENDSLHAKDSSGLGGKADNVMPGTRRLLDDTKITVLVLYTNEGMAQVGYTDAQMMTAITTAFARTNLALTTSGISSLTIDVVKTVLFDQGNAGMVATVLAMDKDDDVTDLRNENGADLVQMMGYFDEGSIGGFGAWFHPYTGFSDVQEDRAFSAVNTDVLVDETHTHEIGHNLGCLHNRENAGTLLEDFSHGYRVCEGDETERFRTIMSYSENCEDAPRQNFFSNPDKTFYGAPTGTATEDNVKEILENMVAVSEYRCTDDAECEAVDEDKICCPETFMCDFKGVLDPEACGDPHMTGFLGQKFDFTGEDSAWYALVSDLPAMHLNMRVTAPVPSLPEITYITGLSLLTADAEGLEHTVIIEVKDPHSISSACPSGVSPCLADGALTVTLDGEDSLLAPGTVVLGPGVSISAVNLPGECRSFGFEKYWERKKLEYAQGGRRLQESRQSMAEWILGDPTATNMAECMEYVSRAMVTDGGLFEHQSEHGSFQIVTPKATIRLSHGRLHQIAMRDPTDQFDLPDHLTWQMNLAINHKDVSQDATGVLGETMVPTRDENGNRVMTGMAAIRGSQEDYRVAGPLDIVFTQGPRG